MVSRAKGGSPTPKKGLKGSSVDGDNSQNAAANGLIEFDAFPSNFTDIFLFTFTKIK